MLIFKGVLLAYVGDWVNLFLSDMFGRFHIPPKTQANKTPMPVMQAMNNISSVISINVSMISSRVPMLPSVGLTEASPRLVNKLSALADIKQN